MWILNWIYSRKGYYALKSGVFVDTVVKKIFKKIASQLNIFLGIMFLEKFIIEYSTKKYTELVLSFSNKITRLKLIVGKFSLVSQSACIVIILLTFFIFFI
jgi:hypothetical protein